MLCTSVVEPGSKAAACVQMQVRRFDGGTGRFIDRSDAVIQEAYLSVQVDGVFHHETTCSPWDIKELVVGGLFADGTIDGAEEVLGVAVDIDAGVASVRLSQGSLGAPDRAIAEKPAERQGRALAMTVTPVEVNRRIELLEDRSLLFRRTGGVHSAVLTDERGIIAWFEDIGRHSAFDKLAGWCLLNRMDVADKVLLFSGRIPREIVVKAVRLGCPVVVSPGAPTDLSIALAERGGLTLIGFGKNGSFNVYSHSERIAF